MSSKQDANAGIVGTMAACEVPDSARINARIRSGFATNHLSVAVRAARAAHNIEKANPGADHGPWFDGMLQEVPIAVVMAAAALEAHVNETIDDIVSDIVKLPVTAVQKEKLGRMNDDTSGNFKDKAKEVIVQLGKKPKIGTLCWDDAGRLIRFRNLFMHFKPTWSDGGADEDVAEFCAAMRRKVGTVKAYEQNFMLPYGLMTYRCARWAVKTALAVSTDFAAQTGTTDRFSLPHLDTGLP